MPDGRELSRDDEPAASIPDVRGLPLETVLRDADHSPLSNALRRLLRDMGEHGESYSAHNTSI